MVRLKQQPIPWNQKATKTMDYFVALMHNYHQGTMTNNSLTTVPRENEEPSLQANRGSYGINGDLRALCAQGRLKEAFDVLHIMDRHGIQVKSRTYASLLQECIDKDALEEGKRVHAHMINAGFLPDVYLRTKLVIMYAKSGNLEYARQLFDKMPERNIVSWNAIVAGYAQHGHGDQALVLFHKMRSLGTEPDEFTFPSVLRACAGVVSMEQGKQVHGCIIRSGFESNVVLGSALVDMYAKCGSIEDARHVFDKMPERNVFSWTAIIAGYGKHGRGKEIFRLFEQMQEAGKKPNCVTFLAILSACSHAGLQSEGWRYFYSMSRDYGITPGVEHYSCMVDLLGRAGRLDEAQEFINRLPFEPHAAVWGTLLGACRMHSNTELGKFAAERLFEIDPQNAGKYVVLSNIYAAAGRWDEVAKVRKLMKDRGVKKEPGCSWIEVQKRVHAFLVGDRSHPRTEEIYAALEILTRQIKEAGYVPQTDFMLHDVEEEQKEHFLGYHSEKLAIAFGIVSLPPGVPIRIVKNLRVCGDCHVAIKFICNAVEREIVVRDSNRFHHFKNGVCSCGDYW